MKRRFKSSGIREKLTIWLLAVFALLSVLYTRVYHERYLDQQRSLLEAHQNTAELLASSVESDLNLLISSHVATGTYLMEQDLPQAAANRYLRNVCSSRSYNLSHTLVSASGECVASSRHDMLTDPYPAAVDVSQAMSRPSPIIRGPYLDDDGRRCIAVCARIRREGRVVGAIWSELSVDVIARHLPRKLDEGIGVAVINRQGEPIHRSSLKPHLSNELLLKQPFVQSARKGVPESVVFLPTRGSEPYLGAAVPLESGNWVLVTATPAGSLLGAARGVLAEGLYTSIGLTAALMLFFWWWCGLFIVGNLRRLTRAASALAVGDFRKRIPVNTNDELGALARAFNQMAESLQTHDRQIEEKSAALQSLLDVAHVVASSLDIETVAAAITQAVNRRFGAVAAALYVNDDDDGLNLLIYRSYSGDDATAPPEDWAEVAMRVYRTRVYYSSAGDAEEGAASNPLDDSRLMVGLPLTAGDRPVGALLMTFAIFEYPEAEALQEHIVLMQGFASHAAIALRNAQTYANAEQYSKSLASWLNELSALRYVTEAITRSLDMQEILQTLVRLTCDVMSAKVCAISLMTPDGVLRVEEAHGLSSRMRELCDCRIGEPLSGIACKNKRAVAVRDLSAEYPELPMVVQAASENLHGYLSVPLITGSEPIGTLDIWKQEAHDFTAYDIDLLSSIAAHSAMVIRNARLFGKEYRIADTLQNVILGNIPDEAPGLSLGSKYIPALEEARVGGDFYDLLALPEGKVGIVVADVSGKGLAVAKHTAMCKFMLRGFAFQWPDQPAKVLEMVSESLCCYAAMEFFVTIFYCVFDPSTGILTYANAGHPPAIWITDSGQRQTLLYQTGIPAGMEAGRPYQDRSLKMSPSDVLVLYTDGLMEARGEKDVLGIEGVQDMLFDADVARDPQSLVEGLYTDALHYASGGLRDDMAIVALKVVGNPFAADVSSSKDGNGSKLCHGQQVEEETNVHKSSRDTGR